MIKEFKNLKLNGGFRILIHSVLNDVLVTIAKKYVVFFKWYIVLFI